MDPYINAYNICVTRKLGSLQGLVLSLENGANLACRENPRRSVLHLKVEEESEEKIKWSLSETARSAHQGSDNLGRKFTPAFCCGLRFCQLT